MRHELVEEEYRQEVFSNPETYPNLYEIEKKRNKYRFESE